jgi:hypothetical protein
MNKVAANSLSSIVKQIELVIDHPAGSVSLKVSFFT